MPRDEKEEELRALGYSPEQIEAYWAERDAPTEIEILTENVAAFEVFRRCLWQIAAGATGAFHVGIPAAEIQACAVLLGVAWDDELFDAVRALAAHAAPILNQRK